MTESRTAAHFQRLYDASSDPWEFASNPYEQAKYRETLLALGDRRFASGLEIGCSIGVLTRMSDRSAMEHLRRVPPGGPIVGSVRSIRPG